MEQNTSSELTLGQRLMADSPTFWKKAELIGLGLIAIGGSLLSIHNISEFIAPAVISAGTVFTTLSKFAVKDTSALANPNATIGDYTQAAKEIPTQLSELKEGITNTVQAIKTGEVKPADPIQETPIIKEPISNIPSINQNLNLDI